MRSPLTLDYRLQPVALMPAKTNGAASIGPWSATLRAVAPQTFFVQVVLSNGDYERLWLALYDLGFRRCIRGDRGLFRLPQGVYKFEAATDADQPIQRVLECMAALQLVGQVVAFRSDATCWAGLELDEDVAIRTMMGRETAPQPRAV